MRIFINGKEEEIDGVENLHDLINFKNLPNQRIVIEVNQNLIKRDQWKQTPLHMGDRIEILKFVGGG